MVGAGAITIVDAGSLAHSSIADAAMGAPVSLTNIRLHVLTHGGSFLIFGRGKLTRADSHIYIYMTR